MLRRKQSAGQLAECSNGTSIARAATMALDGFASVDKNAFVGFSDRTSEGFFTLLNHAAQRLRVEVDGMAQLPDGRALLVGNHAFGFWDLALAVARIRAESGRRVWILGEHLWWRVPAVRRFAAAVGVVDGTNENVDTLLGAGELVLVLPGGLREALKPSSLRYRLLWGRRYGFIRAAIRNDAPLVPLACVGGDDLFDIVGNAFSRAKRLRLGVPLPRPSYGVPFFHPTRIKVLIGYAIAPRAVGHDESASFRSLRREVEGAIHELIEGELARRAGFPYE